ncbi:MAG: histidine phosphatase family protein [Oscillospiraceae bacterium]|nr:histidine phosphatase family protein [Oscillospiraceae bacterium]
MKLLIIRHGDPNYEIDSLTEKGWKEAEMLAERIAPLDIKAYYVSPLGRARDTASLTLKKAGREAEVLPWAREYNTRILGESGERRIPWDMLPEKWTAVPEYYDKDKWYDVPVMKEAGMEEGLRWVWDGLDELLARHGYKREGMYYRAEKPNEDTIAIFCHFGVECVMLGHLLGISPMALWHGFMAAPTSVTTVNTEERRDGIASFRVSAFGDISHLYVKGEEPAFAGRFCETFANTEQRHD